MHEQSETIQGPNGWLNVYGHHTSQAGQPLKPLFPYEMPTYPNLQQADSAAARRSFDTGIMIDAIMKRQAELQQMQSGAGVPNPIQF